MINQFKRAERSLAILYIRRSAKLLLLGFICLLLIHYALTAGFSTVIAVQDEVEQEENPPTVLEETTTTTTDVVEDPRDGPQGAPPFYSDTPTPPQPPQPTEEHIPELPTVKIYEREVLEPIPILILIGSLVGILFTVVFFLRLWFRTPKEIRTIVEKGTYAPVQHRRKTSIIEEGDDIQIQIRYKVRDKGRWGVFQLGCFVPPLLDAEKVMKICKPLGLRFDHKKITTEATIEEFTLRYQLFRLGITRIFESEQQKLFKQYI